MKVSETLKKAIAGGIAIGIGATAYLSIENRVIGAIMFCVGLFSICAFGMNLFTGKIAYVLENKNYAELTIIWIGNLIGSFICALPLRFIKPQLAQTAAQLISNKFSYDVLSLFILSLLCGILVYIAVDNFRNSNNDVSKVVGIFIAVPAFILCGFEHSIADMCYCIFGVTDLETFGRAILLVLVATVGNGLGSIIFRWLIKTKQ